MHWNLALNSQPDFQTGGMFILTYSYIFPEKFIWRRLSQASFAAKLD